MNEREERAFQDVTDALWKRFADLKEHNPNDGRYKCWDCNKEIFVVEIDEETKNSLPMDLEGFRSLLCEDCVKNDDY